MLLTDCYFLLRYCHQPKTCLASRAAGAASAGRRPALPKLLVALLP